MARLRGRSPRGERCRAVEPKADTKGCGIPSPDVADAFALAFGYHVARWEEADEPRPDWGRSPVTGY